MLLPEFVAVFISMAKILAFLANRKSSIEFYEQLKREWENCRFNQ